MYICYKIGRASLANLGVETSVLEFGIRNIKSPLPQELEQQNWIYYVIFWQHCHVWQIENSVRTSTIPMTSKLVILVTYGRWSHLPSHVNFWASRHVRNYYFYIVFLYSCEYIQHKKQQKYSPVQSKTQLFSKFQVSNGTKWTKTFAIQKAWISSRNHFWSSHVLLEALFSIAIIPKGFTCSLD